MAPSNVVLGVLISLARVHTAGVATAEAVGSRVAKVLSFMRAAASADYLSPSQAGKLRGLLGFTLMPVMWRFGRAATQPLAERQYQSGGRFGWTTPLRAMHRFFERNLPHLPPLEVPMFARRRKPVLLYTDAAFFLLHGVMTLTLGIYVLDPVSGEEFWSYTVVPRRFYRHFSPNKKTYILQGEILAAVAAFSTFPDLLRGRDVYMFVDNIGALSALVHGYARKPDCAAMVNSFHSLVRELRCHPWAEWVPSKLNIADWASRRDKHHLLPRTAVRVPMVLPFVADFIDVAD